MISSGFAICRVRVLDLMTTMVADGDGGGGGGR